MEIMKQSMSRTLEENRQLLKEAEERASRSRYREPEQEVYEDLHGNRASRRKAMALARKQ